MTMDDTSRRVDLSTDENELVGAPGDLVTEEAVPARSRSGTVLISLRVDRQVFDDLSRLAEEDGRTFSQTAREALRTFARARAAGTSYPLRGPETARHARKVSEGAPSMWDDDKLRNALRRYEAECIDAGMREMAWRSYVDYARRFLAWRTGDYQPRGVARGDRPVSRAFASTTDLRRQAEQYARQVGDAGRERPTVDTYFRHAMFFIRWLEGDFRPGARLLGLR